MKKEQNAEKTKVRKLARTKEKVSQWTTNPLNEKVLDYHNYEMTKSESVLYFVAAFLVGKQYLALDEICNELECARYKAMYLAGAADHENLSKQF